MGGGTGASGPALPDATPLRASRWNDLSRRVLSGLVLLAIALLCVWAGHIAFVGLVVAGCFLLAGEWSAMCGYTSTDPPAFWMRIVIVAAAMCSGLDAAGGGLVVLCVGGAATMVFSSFSGLARGPWRVRTVLARAGFRDATGARARPEHDGKERIDRDVPPTRRRLELAFGFPYLGLAAVALPWLRADPFVGLPNTLFVLVVVWTSDIGAYLVGRLIGGPKLAPAISPGKTWSGAAGGLVSAALASLAVAACFSPGLSPLHVTASAVALGVVSQAGDLLESALKRHFGVKDSGRIIPGHGGLLDRVDALLAVAPVAALLAFTVGRGVVLWR
jgi:phosphatidate cytidylyltransferase